MKSTWSSGRFMRIFAASSRAAASPAAVELADMMLMLMVRPPLTVMPPLSGQPPPQPPLQPQPPPQPPPQPVFWAQGHGQGHGHGDWPAGVATRAAPQH